MVRCLLGFVFIVSGTLKLMDLESFARVIDAFAILPTGLSGLFSVLISLAELVAGLGLVLDIRGSLFSIMSLLVSFVLVLGWALYMGYDIDCGCFGPGDPEAEAFSSIRTSLFRDIVMLAVIFYLYAWRRISGYTPGSLNLIKKRSLNNEVESN